MDVGLIKQLTDANTATLRKLYGEPVAYEDPDAIGANPVAVKYGDGTIVGSTDNGSYVKRPDGTVEIHCKTDTKYTTDTPTGNIYRSDVVIVAFPLHLPDTDVTVFDIFPTEVENAYCWGGEQTLAASGANGYLISGNATATAIVNFRIDGRWR